VLLQIWSCTSQDPNQLWTISSTSGSISWTGMGFCLDLTKGVDADGTVVCLALSLSRLSILPRPQMQIWTCSPQVPDANQQFTLTTTPGSGSTGSGGDSVSIPITAGSAAAVTGNLLSLSIEQDRKFIFYSLPRSLTQRRMARLVWQCHSEHLFLQLLGQHRRDYWSPTQDQNWRGQ
jgi:hypothetical protein